MAVCNMALAMPKKMATLCRTMRRFQRLHRLPRLSSLHEPKHVCYISTSCACHDETGLKTNSELSWVRRILQGSGPSADVDEMDLEDEVVEVEPRYMEILQESQSSFINSPETRRKNYSPPSDVEETLEEMTLQLTTDTDPVNWKDLSLEDSLLKYQLLSKCSQTFKHSIPNYQLSQMKTVDDVVDFYQTAVKDTSVYDELVNKDLPPNLRIHWDYNDSKLEVYEEYLEYVKRKKSRKPPAWTHRPSH